MKFTQTPLGGAFVVDLEPHADERGFFARTFCAREFAAQGLNDRVVQCSFSRNRRRGTLRGMHWQATPHGECKLIRCTRGAIYDVIIDLRRNSPTFRRWFAVELTAENGRALYVPPDCAHGFQTLEDNTEVFYQMSEYFVPESARGVRWNDPAFGIKWPEVGERIMNARDAGYADFGGWGN